jgi:light-regulated signal transduction histidine kinase (bacteriophytochrome)
MHAMIDGVLDYSSASTREPLFENVDLSDIICTIESDLEVLIQQKGAVIQQENLPVIEGSSVLLYQLFSNLANNALKFAKADAVPLIQLSASTLSGSDAEQMFGLSCQSNYMQVLMQDNGIGFRKKMPGAFLKPLPG